MTGHATAPESVLPAPELADEKGYQEAERFAHENPSPEVAQAGDNTHGPIAQTIVQAKESGWAAQNPEDLQYDPEQPAQYSPPLDPDPRDPTRPAKLSGRHASANYMPDVPVMLGETKEAWYEMLGEVGTTQGAEAGADVVETYATAEADAEMYGVGHIEKEKPNVRHAKDEPEPEDERSSDE